MENKKHDGVAIDVANRDPEHGISEKPMVLSGRDGEGDQIPENVQRTDWKNGSSDPGWRRL